MDNIQNKIYLDYAATTPICDEALLAMANNIDLNKSAIDRFSANANSLYSLGRDSFNRLEEARREAAVLLGASRPSEIVFCASATESVFLSLVGLSSATGANKIVISPIEHSCVVNTAKYIVPNDNDIIYVKTNGAGICEADALEDVLRGNEGSIVSIGMANSEIGTVQNIKDLAECAHKYKCYMHTDMTQAVGKVPINLSDLGVDMASLSSHKICGPVGVGVMYVRNKTPFKTPLKGGNQENGMRGGTQNVVAISGFVAALRYAIENQTSEAARLASLRNAIYDAIREDACFSDIDITLDPRLHPDVSFLPNVAHICLNGIESETSILRFDDAGILVSGGSACSSHTLEPSRTLTSVGINRDRALCALRISFGRWTDKSHIDEFLRVLKEVKKK